jgi:hypothetical protein
VALGAWRWAAKFHVPNSKIQTPQATPSLTPCALRSANSKSQTQIAGQFGFFLIIVFWDWFGNCSSATVALRPAKSKFQVPDHK